MKFALIVPMFPKQDSKSRCGRFPPEVRTAILVEGRIEHIVLSCNATSDHGIIWIEREAQKALYEGDAETVTTAPTVPRFERIERQEKEHKDALERAVTLNIPHSEAFGARKTLSARRCQAAFNPEVHLDMARTLVRI